MSHTPTTTKADCSVSRIAAGEDRSVKRAKLNVEQPSDLSDTAALCLGCVSLSTAASQGCPAVASCLELLACPSRLSNSSPLAAFGENRSPVQQEYDEGMYFYCKALPLMIELDETMRSATVFYNIAQGKIQQGNYEEAQQWLELALVRVQLDPSNVLTAMTSARILHNIGYCLYKLNKNEEALVFYQKALLLASETDLGDIHVAASQNAVILFHRDTSGIQNKDIIGQFERCLAVYRESYGSESTVVATVLNNLGRACHLGEDYDRALGSYEEALLLRSRLLGNDSVDTGATMCNIAQTYHQCGEVASAMQYYKDFLRTAETKSGPIRGDTAFVLQRIGEIYHETGDGKEAKSCYERALAVARTSLPEKKSEITPLLNKLGNLHFEADDLECTLRYYMDGLEIETALLNTRDKQLHVTLTNVAQVLSLLGKYSESLV
jgi:tetratricopeptide (TPR) repeat protein